MDVVPPLLEHPLRDDEVPWVDQPTRGTRAVEVSGLPRRVRDEAIEVGLVDEEALTVQREEVADTRGRQRRVERERVGDHRVEVEELDHRQRAEDLFPPTAEGGCVEHVDHRSLQRADAHLAAARHELDAATHVGQQSDLLGRLHRHVLDRSEAKAPRRVRGEERHLTPHRVGAAVELQRGMVAHGGVGRGHGRDEERVHSFRARACRGRDVQAAPDPRDAAARAVLAEQAVDSSRARARAAPCVRLVREHRVRPEKVVRRHHSLFPAETRTARA